MKTQKLAVPQFLYTQVNKREDGTIISHTDTMKGNVSCAIDVFDSMEGAPVDCFVICSREKVGDDFRYGITVSPMHRDCDFVRIGMPASFKPVLIEPIRDRNIGDIIEKLMERAVDKLLALIG